MSDEFTPPANADVETVRSEAVEEIGSSKDVSASDILRIEGDVDVYWTGVRGCCSSDRINPEVKAGFDRWVSDQRAAHADRVFLQARAPAAEARCNSWGGGPFGDARKCTGRVVLKAWAEFA